ncbi:hypothetical protein [Pontibacter populi]|uniref:Uncharacterized protein n=1 Tax=Pontibacter populi TaxID=890055 RepID=A0ABV1RYX5_9BACT
MNKEVELLKSHTILFSGIELIKQALSDWLIEEILGLNENYNDESILKVKLNSKEEIRNLKEFLDREIKHQNYELYESCIEELREIKEDFKWSNSKDGKFIQKLEDWVLNIRSKISDKGWEKIFIGRSMIDPKELNIGGVVKNEKEADEIRMQIEMWAPPFPPRYLLEVE